MAPYKFSGGGGGFPQFVKTDAAGWQMAGIDTGRRDDGCYACSSRATLQPPSFQHVLLVEQRSCQSAGGLPDRQFNLKEDGGLQSLWQHQTKRVRSSDNAGWSTDLTPSVLLCREQADSDQFAFISMCWYCIYISFVFLFVVFLPPFLTNLECPSSPALAIPVTAWPPTVSRWRGQDSDVRPPRQAGVAWSHPWIFRS